MVDEDQNGHLRHSIDKSEAFKIKDKKNTILQISNGDASPISRPIDFQLFVKRSTNFPSIFRQWLLITE